MPPPACRLIRPNRKALAAYRDALLAGWQPDEMRAGAATVEILEAIAAAPDVFLAELNGEAGRDRPVTLPDGSQVPRLPGLTRWIWSAGFAGQISLRWQPGRDDLPPTCLGHIGYGVVPWMRRRGLATRALALILPEARRAGLTQVEITCRPDNHASRRVIEANGGSLVEHFNAPSALGGHPSLRFLIALGGARSSG